MSETLLRGGEGENKRPPVPLGGTVSKKLHVLRLFFGVGKNVPLYTGKGQETKIIISQGVPLGGTQGHPNTHSTTKNHGFFGL